MHTSGPCTAPSLPHRYTLCFCFILRYLAHLHMPFLSTSHSFGCIKRGTWGEIYKDSVWRAYNVQTEAVSQPWSPMSCCSSIVCWRERTESPSPAHSHRAEEMPQRRKRAREMEQKKCGGTLKEWRSRMGGEANGEDKEVVGEWWEEKGKIEESMIKTERNNVSVFLNLEMLNPFFSLQPAFLGH